MENKNENKTPVQGDQRKGDRPFGKKPFAGRQRNNRARRDDNPEFDKQLIAIRRVTKVVKGGRTLRFSALVAIGNKKGLIGIGMGKAKEVPVAIEKATADARKRMKNISIVKGTIPHDSISKFSASSIIMKPAKEGTGIIAGGAARLIIELAGVKNIVTKIHGSTSKINVAKATFKGLAEMRTKEEIASLRGKSVEEI